MKYKYPANWYLILDRKCAGNLVSNAKIRAHLIGTYLSHFSNNDVIELSNSAFTRSSKLENYNRIFDISLYFPELEEFLSLVVI